MAARLADGLTATPRLPSVETKLFQAGHNHLIDRLRKDGIDVQVFGRGWGTKARWISQEEIVAVFNQSKINLNLSNAKSFELGFLLSSVYSLRDLKEILVLKKDKEQIKGRHYEINGCGGFQLSYFVPGLNLTYEIDREIAVYENIQNLGSEIKYYLQNDALRSAIADNGYRRSHRDHHSQYYLRNLIDHVLKHR